MMQQENFSEDFQSLENIFQVIQKYHQLEFSELLKKITREKEVSVPELFQRLQEQGYYLSQESLYRYFNPNHKSNRFPSEDFIEAFSDVLQLTEDQSKLLLIFWSHYKLIKKCRIVILTKI